MAHFPPPPVTVYVVVEAGLTVIQLVVAPLLQLYARAPLAHKVTFCPEHILLAAGVTVTVGDGITSTVTVPVVEQPVIVLTAVSVYVVVTVGQAVTVTPTVELRPVAGAHV